MDTTTTTSSICNDILSYLTSNHSTFPLNSINVQTSPAAASDSLISYSPSTVHSYDLINDAYKSLWAPKQSEFGKVAVRDGSSSEEMTSLLPQSDQEIIGRYKTELCRPFEENGFCKYGNRCQFAHGRQELRDVDRHPKYKTQLCKTFHTTGICRYGKRCHFIHNEDEGTKTQRQSPQEQQQPQQPQPQPQQQQRPVSGLRKLTGRQNTKSAGEEDQQQQPFQAYSIFPTSSTTSSTTSRYFEEQSSPIVSNRMSLPSSTSSSPSPSLASFNDDAFFQPSLFSAAANDNISQMPPICWRKTSTSPSFSSLPGSIDLFSHPLSVRPTMATESSSSSSSSSFSSASVQQKGISSSSSSSRWDDNQQSCQREVVDLILRNLNKSQMQLLVEHLLFQTQKRNAAI